MDVVFADKTADRLTYHPPERHVALRRDNVRRGVVGLVDSYRRPCRIVPAFDHCLMGSVLRMGKLHRNESFSNIPAQCDTFGLDSSGAASPKKEGTRR